MQLKSNQILKKFRYNLYYENLYKISFQRKINKIKLKFIINVDYQI